MHLTTPSALRMRHIALALGALLVLMLAVAAPALAAKAPFDGGPIPADTATYSANDHTVYAMRFTATTGGSNPLDANTTYYVKVRFSTDTATGQPASTDNRGFVWNGTTQQWVQESDSDWTKFPTVTTDGTGAISQSPWIYYKFGDTTKTGEYALIVSLSIGVSGNTKNGTTWVNVQVFDPTDQTSGGGWVHPGVDNSAYADKRGDVVDHASPSTLLALRFNELNGVDDDSNGVVDDEVYGPTQAGGFDLGVPAGKALDVRMQKSAWFSDFTLAVPDTDIALSSEPGADMTAPSAPGTLSATATSSSVDLSWGVATDNTGVTGYDIYRAADADTGTGFTAPYVKIAAVTGTTYEDSVDLSGGASYHYMVRAVDAATNVGPRSNTVGGALATLTMTRSAKTVRYHGKATLTGALASAVSITGDEIVAVQWSHDNESWTEFAEPYDLQTPYVDGYAVQPGQKTYYRLVWAGDATHLGAVSNALAVTPKVKLGTPKAPKAVKKRAKFKVYGSLAPRHAAGRKYVTIKCYRKVSGHWRLRKTVKARDYNHGSATRYSAKFALTSKGSWKLVASYKATAKYAATTSSARLLKVK